MTTFFAGVLFKYKKKIPIDDMGQFIYSPTVHKIDFDFESHPAAAELVGDALSFVVCGEFPVVT